MNVLIAEILVLDDALVEESTDPPFIPVFHDGGTTYEFDDEARRASQPRVTGR